MKRAADIAHCDAIDALAAVECDDHSPEKWEAEENNEAACHIANEVDWEIARTMPTTLAGVAAVLRFANEIENARGEWPNTDTIGPDGWHYQLRATMAAAIETILSKRPSQQTDKVDATSFIELLEALRASGVFKRKEHRSDL